jgi:hypothetical protein
MICKVRMIKYHCKLILMILILLWGIDIETCSKSQTKSMEKSLGQPSPFQKDTIVVDGNTE